MLRKCIHVQLNMIKYVKLWNIYKSGRFSREFRGIPLLLWYNHPQHQWLLIALSPFAPNLLSDKIYEKPTSVKPTREHTGICVAPFKLNAICLGCGKKIQDHPATWLFHICASFSSPCSHMGLDKIQGQKKKIVLTLRQWGSASFILKHPLNCLEIGCCHHKNVTSFDIV